MVTFEREKNNDMPLFAFQAQGAEAGTKLYIKASNPNLFIPKSNVTIPAYKSEC